MQSVKWWPQLDSNQRPIDYEATLASRYPRYFCTLTTGVVLDLTSFVTEWAWVWCKQLISCLGLLSEYYSQFRRNAISLPRLRPPWIGHRINNPLMVFDFNFMK